MQEQEINLYKYGIDAGLVPGTTAILADPRTARGMPIADAVDLADPNPPARIVSSVGHLRRASLWAALCRRRGSRKSRGSLCETGPVLGPELDIGPGSRRGDKWHSGARGI